MTTPVGPNPGESYASRGSNATQSDLGVDSTYLDIGGESPPPMKTLVYTPDVRIFISHGGREYDVSADIVACSVQRNENSVSTAVFKLANKKDPANPNKGSGRYTPLFTPMDRVIIQMKRVEWVQVFAGFLDRVPLAQLYPGTVDFRASCTLKRLLHTWWDPGLPASAALFDQFNISNNEADGMEGFDRVTGQAVQRDAGLGSTLRQILIKVGNWDSRNIHIQRFPMGYFNYMKQQLDRYAGTEESVEKFRWMLLGDDTSGGVGPAAGRQVGVNKGGYVMTQIERKIEVIRAVDEMGMGPSTKDLAFGQGLGTTATAGSDYQDQQAWKGQVELSKNYSEAAMKNDAAVHCFMTVYVESGWMMWANKEVPESFNYPNDGAPPWGGDHDSVGLFQQRRAGWGSIDQRMNARESAGMFLRELNKLDWRNMDRGTACQAVQRSAYPGRYAGFETIAQEEVRAIRTGTGAPGGASGQGGTLALGTTALGTAPPPITAGVGGTSVIPALPTTNGRLSPASATVLVGKPQFDLAKAISYGLSRQGTPYVYGAPGPATFDCSSFTQWCYRSMGLEIGRNTHEQRANGQKISMASVQPGDLLQPADGEHVVMWLGGGMILHAPQSGDVVKVAPLYFTPASVLHYPPAEYGGTYPVPFDIPTGAGAPVGTVAQGPNGSTTTTGSNEPLARNLFSWMFEPGQFLSYTSTLFGNESEGSPREAAFMNDEPLIQTVVSLAKAGLRNFQSLPNGDFCAYYPDYFGLDGKDAVMDLEDIELKNVQIDLNDDALATHVYVAGSMMPNGASNGLMGWLNTKGIATVENNWLFRRMAAAAPQVRGGEMLNGEQIMRKYGARPLTQNLAAIQSGAMEFLLAMQIFMTKWAEQYSTNIELAFMPELYPGMRINFKNHNLQVYVAGVTHSGDFENGFTTQATIMAPSTPDIRRVATQIQDQFTSGGWDQSLIDGSTMPQWMHPGG